MQRLNIQCAVIFAMLSGRPAVLNYNGNLSQPFDNRYAHEISFQEAKGRIEKMHGKNPPILFAPPGWAVVCATKGEALDLLQYWIEGVPHKIPRRTDCYRSKVGIIVE